MAIITVDTDPGYAPCAYFICRVTGTPGKYDWDTRDEANTVLVQSDWDFPGVAASFGWRPRDGATDSEMIHSAIEYLDTIAGSKFVDDPGYFTEDDHETA